MKTFFSSRLFFFFGGILLFSLIFISVSPIYATEINIKELVKLTNESRVRQGLSPLVYNSILSTAARNKGRNMIAKGYWAHFGPNKELDSPWYFIKNSGYIYEYAGENLAKGFNSALSTHSAWMNSPTHRQNIMNANYKDIGISVLQGVLSTKEGQLTLVVQMFGTLSGQRTSFISNSDLEIGNWLNINKPSKNAVFTGNNISIVGTTSVNNAKIAVNINRQNIANIGIMDYKFKTTISNRFPNKELIIQASTKLSEDIVLSDSSTVFNNLGNYLENYYVKNLTATEKEGQVILMVPNHQYVTGVNLKSCYNDYQFIYQGDAYLLAINKKQFQKINDCSKKMIVLRLLDGQDVQSSIKNINTSGFEIIEQKELIQTYLGYTQQNKIQKWYSNITWFILSLVFILLGYIIMTVYHYDFYHRRSLVISLFILLIVGTVKLVFNGGGIV